MEEKLIQARVPEKLYREIEKRVVSGMYENKSEVIRDAIRKLLAEHGRDSLREFAKKAGITEKEMLKELKKLRR